MIKPTTLEGYTDAYTLKHANLVRLSEASR
jgi:hypothetical protein